MRPGQEITEADLACLNAPYGARCFLTVPVLDFKGDLNKS